MRIYPKNPFFFGSQNYEVYNLLLTGPQTGRDIQRLGILSHSRRISDLREALEPLGWTVKSKLVNGNPRIYEYRIAPYLTLFEEAV